MNDSAKTPTNGTLLPLSPRLSLLTLSVFTDNYIWLLADIERGAFWLVDPGDKDGLQKALSSQLRLQPNPNHLSNQNQSPHAADLIAAHLQSWTLEGVLITHHHYDHIGGLEWLIETYPPFPIIGPKHPKIPWITQWVNEGDQLDLLGLECQVLSVPGHTLDHVAYFLPNDCPLLFCGDTLFAAGCGRLFEGSPQQMRLSLQKIRQLPQKTLICCAHEYTQANLEFALAVTPNNEFVQARQKKINTLRKRDACTLPTYLGEELLTNPFLRWDSQEIIHSAIHFNHLIYEKSCQTKNSLNLHAHDNNQLTQKMNADWVFSVIRSWKNNF